MNKFWADGRDSPHPQSTEKPTDSLIPCHLGIKFIYESRNFTDPEHLHSLTQD